VEVYLRSRWRRTEEEPTDPGSAGKTVVETELAVSGRKAHEESSKKGK